MANIVDLTRRDKMTGALTELLRTGAQDLIAKAVARQTELRPCYRTLGYFTPVHERGTKWYNIDGNIQTIIRRRRLRCFMKLGQSSVAKELGITSTQLKTWRLEVEAFGSVEAKQRQQADAAELICLRKENKRLAEEVEILHKTSAFFATRAVKPSLSRQGSKLTPICQISLPLSLPKTSQRP